MNGTEATRADDALLDEATDVMVLASRVMVGLAARSLAATELDITLPQLRALVMSGAAGELNIGSLADALGIHPSTATRLCDRLVAKGLIERAPSAENRREVSMRLSVEGERVVGLVMQHRRDELHRIIARLEPGTQRVMADAFLAFADAAGETRDAAWKLGWTK